MNMKTRLLSLLAVGTLLFASSCTKTITVSKGDQSRDIKVAGKIQMGQDEDHHTIASFVSVDGTRQNVNLSEYALTIK